MCTRSVATARPRRLDRVAVGGGGAIPRFARVAPSFYNIAPGARGGEQAVNISALSRRVFYRKRISAVDREVRDPCKPR